MKMHAKKAAGLLALLLAALMLLAACGSEAPAAGSGSTPSGSAVDNETGLTTPGVLNVGMECAYAPFNWTQLDDSNGAVALGDGTYANGYDVQIAKHIAEKLGLELKIHKISWDGLPPALQSGKIDMIIAGMSNNPERRETFDFSENYYSSDMVIVVRKDSAYANATSLADFSGAKITGQLNTSHYSVIDQIPGVVKQQAMDDFPTMIVALQSGMVDGYVSERPGALAAVGNNPDLTFVSFEDGNGFEYDINEVSIAIAMRKNSPLTDQANQILAGISEDERQQMMDNAVANQP